MRILLKFCCLLILLGFHSYSYGQIGDYSYQRELNGISDSWHKIILPNDIFGKTQEDLSDLRIYGISKSGDTIEAPYLLQRTAGQTISKEVSFKVLNTVYQNQGYYFTIENPSTESINQIKLEFEQANFDWRLKLEGSQDQAEWYTVVENYRILSIRNNETEYQFTKLTFPSAKYRFFRVFIETTQKPELSRASLFQNEISEGKYRNYGLKKSVIKENKQTKQTEIDLELELAVPLCSIHIAVLDSFDYYRPIRLKYLVDSFKTEQGWKYQYADLASGTLNSIEKEGLIFQNVRVQKMKIYIDNQDNRALQIGKLELMGYEHEMLVRFTEAASYFLTYGNKNTAKPNYDIQRFSGKIPQAIKALILGEEKTIQKAEPEEREPLFINKNWLWLIMAAIILSLGWFSLKMIRNT